MSYYLKQQHFFVKRNFEITDHSLKITVKQPFKHFEEEFSFEEIAKKTFVNKTPNRYIFIACVVSLIGLLITSIEKFNGDKTISFDDILFYIVFSSTFCCLLWFTYRNTINLMIVDKRYILFYAKSPDSEAVRRFIDMIFSEQKKYLVERYARRLPYVSNEKLMDQLLWLKERYIIDDKEFEIFKNDLLSQSNPLVVGFAFKNSSN